MFVRRIICLFFMLLLVTVSAVSYATENEVTDKVDDQAQMLLWKINKSGTKAFIPDISLVGMITGAYFRDDPAVAQGPHPSRTGFNFQGAELAVQSVVDPYVRADVFIHFLENQFGVEEAYITTLALPLNMQIKAGKMRAYFGRENMQHLAMTHFVDYSRLRRYFFGNEGLIEWGAELSVMLPVSWHSQVVFEFLQGDNDVVFNSGNKRDFAYLSRFENTFDLGDYTTMQFGLSGALGNNSTAAGNLTQIYGADLYLRWRPSIYKGLKWQTEYFYRRLEAVAKTQVEGGLSSQFIYQFARRWETGVRFDMVGLPEDGFKQYQTSPVLTFMASPFFRLKAQYNYLHTDGANHAQHEAFLQMIFNMGPHGAHTF